jgi:hypothetical protein
MYKVGKMIIRGREIKSLGSHQTRKKREIYMKKKRRRVGAKAKRKKYATFTHMGRVCLPICAISCIQGRKRLKK